MKIIFNARHSGHGEIPHGLAEFTKEVLAQLLTQLVYDPVNVDEELVDERWATLETQNAHVLATMQIPDLSDQLASIDINTLVFWGTEDRFCLHPEPGKFSR